GRLQARIPNYALPPNEDNVEILRIVVRESFSQDLVYNIVADVIWAAETLTASEQQFDVEVLTKKKDHRAVSDDKGAYGRQC
ncbi:hypothetical protein BGZ65_012000, partial [Modicella reniformis]